MATAGCCLVHKSSSVAGRCSSINPISQRTRCSITEDEDNRDQIHTSLLSMNPYSIVQGRFLACRDQGGSGLNHRQAQARCKRKQDLFCLVVNKVASCPQH